MVLGGAELAISNHYTDAGFVVNLVYEVIGFALFGLAVVAWVGALLMNTRRRK